MGFAICRNWDYLFERQSVVDLMKAAVSSERREYGRKADLRMVLAIVVVAFGVRIAFASIYSVATFRDSDDYLILAQQLKNWDLSENNGWRTPVYSILILLASFNLDVIWLLQSLMGIIISIVIFLLISSATGSRQAGAIAALAQALALNQLALEASILTETTATLFWSRQSMPSIVLGG